MKKIVTVVSLVLVVALLFASCNCGDNPPPELHESVTELKETIENMSKKAEGTTKANLYYDNTQSMYGFICDQVDVKSNFTIVCQDLSNIIKGYNDYSINALCPNEEKLLKWSEIGIDGFYEFRKKDFYSFPNTSHSGSFDRAHGESGPLQSVFNSSESPVNFDELNVFVTDLAEQELNNKLLAQKINDIVLEKEDHSVAFYCIESYFDGFASVPASGVTSNGHVKMIDADYTGERVFYCVIVGPTIDVVGMCNSLDSTLKSSGLVENSDFYSAKVLSKRGLQYAPITNAEKDVFNNLFVDFEEEDKYNDYEQYQSGISFENTNLNFNVTPLHYDDFFGKQDDKQYGLYYQYDTTLSSLDKSTYGNAIVNFVLPLSGLADGSTAENVKYELPIESVKLYGCFLDEVETTDKEGQDTTAEVPTWEEIDYQHLFESSEPYMFAPVCEAWENGQTIDRVQNMMSNQDLIDEEYPLDKGALYTVKNENGALRVKLAFKDIETLSDKYTHIILTCDITAKKELDTNIPSWITEKNLSDSANHDSSNTELYTKTAGLLDFYKFLIGNMSSPTERNNFEAKMTKTITDVLVGIKLSDD